MRSFIILIGGFAVAIATPFASETYSPGDDVLDLMPISDQLDPAYDSNLGDGRISKQEDNAASTVNSVGVLSNVEPGSWQSQNPELISSEAANENEIASFPINEITQLDVSKAGLGCSSSSIDPISNIEVRQVQVHGACTAKHVEELERCPNEMHEMVCCPPKSRKLIRRNEPRNLDNCRTSKCFQHDVLPHRTFVASYVPKTLIVFWNSLVQ